MKRTKHPDKGPRQYVVYYRVSTDKQGQSGLGLDAQQTAVKQFLQSNAGTELPPSYTEIESGRKNTRPQLRKAIDRCKQTGSTLLIAKIDRLARNVKFIFTLKEELESAGVGFIACDMPDVNTMTLGVIASVAQHESETISKRIKAAMAEGKKRGKRYGSPQNLTDAARNKAHASIRENSLTDTSVRHAWHFIQPLRAQGLTYAKIAEMLNAENYQTRTGKQFYPQQVSNICKRFGRQQKST